ncbi:MAG: hypothetical protein HUU45_05315 [Leptospiraceae bacterium]|nr:hypothetical protein [Leptospiraceae bacterium]
MRKLLSSTMSALLVFSSLKVHAGEPLEKARTAIKISHEQARNYANNLVTQDLVAALVDSVTQSVRYGRESTAYSAYANATSALEKKVNNFLSKADNNPMPSEEFIAAIWNDYKNIVRERFAESFKVQEALYDQNLFLKSAENALYNFHNICNAGRSDTTSVFDVNTMANVGPANFNIYLQYQIGPNGGLTQFNSQSSSAAGGQEGRQTTGAAINTVAGVSSSIAVSGGSGAVVTGAIAVAPYAVAAAVAYAAVTAYQDAMKQKEIDDEITEANVQMLLNTANDRDVAKYYREICRSVSPVISSIQQNLTLAQKGDQDRTKILQEALSLKSDIATFEVDAEKNKTNKKVSELYALIIGKQCVVKSEETKAALCFRTGSAYVLASDDSISLPLDANEIEKIAQPINLEVKAFSVKYPNEKIARLIGAKTMLILLPEWERTSSAIAKFTFNEIDKKIYLTFERVQGILAQLRMEKDALWTKSNPDLSNELNASADFEALKKTHRALVAEGIQVIFDRKPRADFQGRVSVYLTRARAFGKIYYKHKEVKSYINCVEALSRLYKNL